MRWWLVLLSGFSAGVVLFAPTRVAVAGTELPTGKDVFGVAPACPGRRRVPGIAAIVIIAGALWSVIRLARRREPAIAGVRRIASSPAQLVVGNLLIAAGTLVLSASGTLAGRLGKDTAFAITLLDRDRRAVRRVPRRVDDAAGRRCAALHQRAA